jgi:hypothetical protein
MQASGQLLCLPKRYHGKPIIGYPTVNMRSAFVEEVSGRNHRHFFWASRTDSAVIIDTLPFDAVPAEMEFGKRDKRRKRCQVFSRSRQSTPPCQEEPTSFSEYVAVSTALRFRSSDTYLPSPATYLHRAEVGSRPCQQQKEGTGLH